MNDISMNTSTVMSGPSGRAMAQPMETSLVEALYQHLTMERNSSAQYFAMSLWFAERELRGFASFFKHESLSEQEHASNFANYLIARGQSVVLQDIAAPNQQWESIESVICHAFQMEADVTSSLHQLYSLAERATDTRSNVFLDPIIESQTKSEDEFAHILGKVRFANEQPPALLIIDNELSTN
ncbi:ferritin [Prochlorococcus marinus]|uniref:Ferritin n=1 Tax=Prochlorococcus marinus (strain MIT 9211) TaxID=93059 RepID=A9BAM5_PROM4|nr:ferritin [Prochlorococcus marinus]ABX08887.1 ferritin [Prochlorococcus marinus str. MIT 9211]